MEEGKWRRRGCLEHDQKQRRGCDEQRRVRVCVRSGDRRELGRCRTCGDSTGTGRDGGWSDAEVRRRSVSCWMIDVLMKDRRNGGETTAVALPFSIS